MNLPPQRLNTMHLHGKELHIDQTDHAKECWIQNFRIDEKPDLQLSGFNIQRTRWKDGSVKWKCYETFHIAGATAFTRIPEETALYRLLTNHANRLLQQGAHP